MNRKPMIKKSKEHEDKFILSYVFDGIRQQWEIPYVKARSAYNGLAEDVVEFVDGYGAVNRQKKGAESLAAWLDRVLGAKCGGRPDWNVPGEIARDYMLTPSVMERIMKRKDCGSFLELTERKGGWGGARVGAGKGYVPPMEKLAELASWREVYIKKSAESWSLMPYKTFESIWESVYHKKASKKLFAQFAADVAELQKGE